MPSSAGAVIGIDASRNRSGGAKVHLRGILEDSDPLEFGIKEVHVWSYKSLLDELPSVSWLVKHNPPPLQRSLLQQMWWQYWKLPIEARSVGCDLLLNTDAGSVCRFQPAVVMSRDMLSYEPGEINRYGFSRARLRLILLRHVQNRSMRLCEGVIFLTQHAASVIQQATGRLKRVVVIPHGVSDAFKQATPSREWPVGSGRIDCLYVSNAAMYKHQWTVVRAVAELRRLGHNIHLTLAGGGSGRAARLLAMEIRRTDPSGEFVKCLGYVDSKELPALLASAHLFVFASSCENMPNTLVEAMAVGLPIACSNRGPMPEVLGDAGVYFDPEDFISIAKAIDRLIVDSDFRLTCAARARSTAIRYSWSRCGRETWQFLLTVAGTK